MVDKISGWTPSQTRRTDGPARSAAVGSGSTAGKSAESGQGTRTSLLDQARAKASASSGIDQAKVDDIKGAISRGEFTVNAPAVAKAFMAMESGF